MTHVGRSRRASVAGGRRYLAERLEHRTLLAFAVPAMSSLPGAPHTLYLDFDGDAATFWNNGTQYLAHGPASDGDPIPAFDWDGNPNSLSATETAGLKAIFSTAAEKFSPFDVNVTTVDPGNLDDNVTEKVIIGGKNTDWLNKPASGISAIGGYSSSIKPNTCYVFANGYPDNAPFLGNVVAHEAGHAFGYVHERSFNSDGSINEYYAGDTTRSPIMGASGDNGSRKIWWQTNLFPGQNSPDMLGPFSTPQDEVPNLYGTLGQHADDFSGSNVGALTLGPDGHYAEQRGIVETYTDQDPWRFTAVTSRATFTVANAESGGMLAPSAYVRGDFANSPVVAGVTSSDNKSTTLEYTNLNPGSTYILYVGSVGNYGDIGGYRITGTAQTFATVNAASRTLNVGGLAGNNNLTLSYNFSTASVVVSDSVNGGPITSQSFAASSIDHINVDLGNGDDIVTVNSFLKPDGVTPYELQVDQGGGFNTLRIANPGSFTTFNVDNFSIGWTTANTRSMSLLTFGSDRVEFYGSNADDTLNINTINSFDNPGYYFYASAGDDRLYVSPSVMQRATSTIVYDGEAGSDTLELNASSIAQSQRYTVFNNIVQRFPENEIFASEVQFGTNVETVTLRGANGAGQYSILGVRAGLRVNVLGNDGNDSFLVGSSTPAGFELPFSANIRGTVAITAYGGDDRLVVDDKAYGSVGTYTIDGLTGIRNTFVGNAVSFDSTLDHIEFYARNGGSTTTVTTPLLNQDLKLDGGTGGVAALTVDFRSGLNTPSEVDLYPDRVVNVPGGITPTKDYRYSGFESLTVWTANYTHTINVFGTSLDIASGQQTTLRLGTGNDIATLYPRDSAGNATITSPVGVFGGAGTDQFIVDDRTYAAGLNYVIDNAGGASTTNVSGIGPAGVGAFNDVETVAVLAGDSDDTFAVNSVKSGIGISLSGGGGNDTVNFGATNLSANMTNATAFAFDGGSGSDAFVVDNSASNVAWEYDKSAASIKSLCPSTGYTFTATQTSNERTRINAGSGADDFVLVSTAPNEAVDLYGAAGNDDLLNAANTVALVQGAVSFFGEAGADNRIILSDTGVAAGVVAHVDATSIGAYAGDTLFGAGGKLTYSNANSLSLTMSQGADQLFASSSATTLMNFDGSSPTTAPGDHITIGLAGVTSPVVTNTTASSGNVASSNRRTLAWAGFESAPVTDSIAPIAQSATYLFNAATPSISLVFSEPIATPLTADAITLVNTTTGQTINKANLVVTYDAATFTAHIAVTGGANGTLADGNYRLTVLPGFADTAGNVSSAQPFFDFFVLAGDANRDRKVDFADLVLLAQNYNQTGKTFSQGNFNYSPDGKVDFADLVLLAQHYNVALPAVSVASAVTAANSPAKKSKAATTIPPLT